MNKSFSVAIARAGACVAVGLLASAAFGQGGTGPRERGEPAKRPTTATGIWDASCASCHGGNGAGKDGKAKSLLGDALMEQSLDRPFFDTVTAAKGPHAVAAGLSEKEAWALIVHLRELQHNEWRKRVGSPKADKAGVYTSKYAKFKVETVYDKGLDTPWAVEWLPVVPPPEGAGARGGSAALPTPARVVVTERDGELNVYEGTKHLGIVKGLPKLVASGQGGLMDAAAHPDYAKNGWLYLIFAEANPAGRGEMTKVVRGKLTESRGSDGAVESLSFTDQRVIFQPHAGDYNGAGVHYGARIVFEKPGAGIADAKGRYYIHFAIGERGGMEQAQKIDRPNGKNHRLWDDGAVPSDNPHALDTGKGVYGSVWSKGHRNQQGVCFDDEGNLWVTEHAPRGGDELNLIARGANYGWPQVSFGINYSDSPFVTPWKEKAADGTPIVMPVYRWIKSIAACGLDCARSADVKGTFPAWSGDLFAGGLAGQNVDRLRVKDGKLVEREEIVHGMGRVRDVAFGPDGFLYLVLNSPDKVVRLVPAK
ncbi:MAG: PQQ-dependent sugar dehydrogenase [Phycisphaerales bacterium]|nr:PQQ-dependent sugar dehydrogenase [Phycisphaerales bacterium]